MQRTLHLILFVTLTGCSGSDGIECGGCAIPPMCEADGEFPSSGGECSCGCTYGQSFAGGFCNENQCIVPTLPPCHGPDATAEVSIGAPSEESWTGATSELPSGGDGSDVFPLVIDVGECSSLHYSSALPLGSAWAQVVAASNDGDCRVWLGGETEDPLYDGLPTMFCSFPRYCPDVLAYSLGNGGPALIESPYCVTPGTSAPQ